MNIQIIVHLTNGNTIPGTIEEMGEGYSAFKEALYEQVVANPNYFRLVTEAGWTITPFASILCIEIREFPHEDAS